MADNPVRRLRLNRAVVVEPALARAKEQQPVAMDEGLAVHEDRTGRETAAGLVPAIVEAAWHRERRGGDGIAVVTAARRCRDCLLYTSPSPRD